MNTSTVLWAALIAASYIAWPLLGKWSGATATWVSCLVTAGTLIGTFTLNANRLIKEPVCSLRAITIVLIAGVVNGVAVYFYSYKVNDQTVPAGVFLMTVYIFMVVYAPTLDWLLNGTTLSARQFCGLGVALVAIYLLRK